MTIEELRQVANRWRPKYSSEAAFEKSWDRLCEWADQHAKQLVDMDVDRWLFDDLKRDEQHAAGRVHTPAVPKPSGAAMVDCSHCAGLGFVRVELSPGQTGFGEAVRCPACLAGARRCPCTLCEFPGSADHALCVDESGHDLAHPQACPRCLAAGVDQSASSTVVVRRPDGSVDHVGTLVARMAARRRESGKPTNAYEQARASGFVGSLEDWSAVVNGRV